MQETEHLRIEVAGIVLSILSTQERSAIQFEEVYQRFLSTTQPGISVCAHYQGLPHLAIRDKDLVFDSEGVWRLYKVEGRYALVLRAPASGSQPYQVALFDDELAKVEIHSEPRRLPNGLLPDPLQFPLAEVLMVCLLARGRGLMVHACGVDDGGRGYLLAGNSGHGKTTMARLWHDRAKVLNDERIVLRQHKGRFWIYGTPWYSDYFGVSPRAVPLEKVFFLGHAGDHCAQRKEGASASSALFARCFPPLWHQAGMRFTLDFIVHLVEAVPCYELGFLPDPGVVDYVRCVP